jgi:uncharacterized membrane protein
VRTVSHFNNAAYGKSALKQICGVGVLVLPVSGIILVWCYGFCKKVIVIKLFLYKHYFFQYVILFWKEIRKKMIFF